MCRLGAAYWPSLLVFTVRASPVSVLVTVMETLGTAAPVGSVTVPTMVASWANAEVANRARKKQERRGRKRGKRPLLTRCQLPTGVGERDFIGKPPKSCSGKGTCDLVSIT